MSIWKSRIFKTPKPEFAALKGQKWEWSMLKPKLPELPNVTFSRTEDNMVLISVPIKGEVKEFQVDPKRFFKQSVYIIREIKSLIQD